MTPTCAVHPEAASFAACVRCGRFCCEACLDPRRTGWCLTCARRPEARLEISTRAKAVLGWSIAGLVFVPLVAVSWWLERTKPAPFLEADEPLLVGARWTRAAAAISWVAALALWLRG